MKVRELRLQAFMSHGDSHVVLPERGVVLVTGPNGAGKSSLVEGVSWACWGKTLRGTDPTNGVRCSAEADAEGVLVVRTKNATASAKLRWTNGGTPVEYETTTKAQAALEAVIGAHDVWRRTHVFSSADAAHFTLATDAERKRLLEALLGLERFDDALEHARTDLKIATAELHTHQRAHEHAAQLLVTAEQLYEQAAKHLASIGEICLRDPTEVGQALEELREEKRSLREEFNVVAVKRAELIAKRSALREQLDTLRRHGECPTCESDLTSDRVEALVQRLNAEHDALHQQIEQLIARSGQFTSMITDLEDDIRRLQSTYDAMNERAIVARAQRETAVRVSAEIDQRRDDVQRAESFLRDRARLVDAADRRVNVMSAVARVLGLRGVRAHVLGAALSGIEAAANAWLVQLAGPGLRLRLAAYTERTGGTTSDAISLEVHGAGGGRGYRAASGGERRRIDVALLLALADVAAAAHAQAGGTLWFDEVFDALDADGVGALGGVLAALAADRAVVVVTHNPAVAAVCAPALRLEVAGGTVTVR